MELQEEQFIPPRVRPWDPAKGNSASAQKVRSNLGGMYMRKNQLSTLHAPRFVDHMSSRGEVAGFTIVWRFATSSVGEFQTRQMIEYSIAYQHPKDQYIKSEGRYHAALRFEKGQRVLLRLPRKVAKTHQVQEFLSFMFT